MNEIIGWFMVALLGWAILELSVRFEHKRFQRWLDKHPGDDE